MRALIFDFNGTLSDDEPVLCELFCELFAERGRPLTPEQYYEQLAGLSDPEIVERWLGHDDPDLVEELLRRYLERAGDGSTVHEDVREAVHYAAERTRLAIVSGALRVEVERVVAGAGLAGLFEVIVAAEDTEHGKPDPAGYLLALEQLALAPADAVAFEDSEDGVIAAKAAGLYCVALLGTATPDHLARADEVDAELNTALIEQLLTS